MKSLALAVVMAVVLGAAGGAAAQQAPSSPPESSQPPADSKNTNVEVNIGGSARPGADAAAPAAPAAPAPAAPAQTETKSPNLKSENRQDTTKDDAVAASPRSGNSDRSMIFGLSPVTAVVIAAALLVVVILAIVAMTRSNNDTYIDTHRGV